MKSERRSATRLIVSIALALAVGVSGLLAGGAAAQTAVPYDANGVRATALSLAPSGSTVNGTYTIDVARETHFTDVVIAVRDPAGRNYDFGNVQDVTVEPGEPVTFSSSRTLPDESYRAWISYRTDNGAWTDLPVNRRFNVGQLPPAPPGGPWTLVFRDEFNGTTLDTGKWATELPRTARPDAWTRRTYFL